MSNKDRSAIGDLFEGFDDARVDAQDSALAIKRVRLALLSQDKRSMRTKLSLRRNLRIRRLATIAAVFTLVCGFVVLPIIYTGQGSTAFAQTKKLMDSIQTATFDVTLEVNGKATETRSELFRSDGMTRENFTDGRYSVIHRINGSVTRMDVNPALTSVRTFYGFSNDDALDPINVILNLKQSENAVQIAPRVINGKSCPGFLLKTALDKSRTEEFRIWVDPGSRLPLRTEHTVRSNLVSDEEHTATPVFAVATCTNFKYDMSLQDSLFQLTPPDGFAATVVGNPATQRSDDWSSEELLLTIGQGIGRAKFGMSMEEVLKALGEPDDKSQEGFKIPGGERWMYNSQGFSLMFRSQPEPKLDRVSCRSSSFMRSSFRGKTKKAIGLGSSTSEVQHAYGQPDVDVFSDDKSGRLFIYKDKRLYIGFEHDKIDHLYFYAIPEGHKSKGG